MTEQLPTNESLPVEGWYPDPHTPETLLRWWDGRSWTEHVHELGATARGATPPRTVGSLHAPAAASEGDGGQTATPVGTTNAPKAIILAAAILIVVGAIGAGLLSFGATVSDQRTTLDRLQPGHQMTYRVTRNGEWAVAFDAPAGRLIVDVRGHDGFDPMATLYTDAGQQVAFNDDRGTEGTQLLGGHHLDALIDVPVPAGRYQLVVEGWNGQAGNGHIQFVVVGSQTAR